MNRQVIGRTFLCISIQWWCVSVMHTSWVSLCFLIVFEIFQRGRGLALYAGASDEHGGDHQLLQECLERPRHSLCSSWTGIHFSGLCLRHRWVKMIWSKPFNSLMLNHEIFFGLYNDTKVTQVLPSFCFLLWWMKTFVKTFLKT